MSAAMGRLNPADLTAAQRDPALLAELVEQGRVKPLSSPGLDACRAGDVAKVSKLV